MSEAFAEKTAKKESISTMFQKKLGRFFHRKNLDTVITQYLYLVECGISEENAFLIVCKVFDAAKSEFLL